MPEAAIRRPVKKKGVFLYFYVFCMCLYIYNVADILWFERIPLTLCCLLTIFVSSAKIISIRHSITRNQFVLCTCIGVYFFLHFFVWSFGGNFFYLITTAFFLSTCSIILLPFEEKKMLLKAVSFVLAIILLVSIPAWFLFVAGFELPHTDVIFHQNGFHEYYDYYFFRLGAKKDDVFDLILPRFSSMFLEPGQLATPCAFIFFLNGAKFNWRNIIFLVAILLSFSLVAYALLFWTLFSRIIITSKHVFLQFLLGIVAFCGVAFYFTQFEDEDHPLNMFVFSRIEYDEEKGISGNNRTTSYFEKKYLALMNSSDCYLGINQKLKEGSDWTYNCSGYKKFIVHQGIIGFAVFMLFIVLLFLFNKSKESFLFLVLLITAFFIRDLLQSPLWLSIAIIGFSILKNNKVFLQMDAPKIKTAKAFSRKKFSPMGNVELLKKENINDN